MVHAKPDDYQTDPSGESGDHIACAVLTGGEWGGQGKLLLCPRNWLASGAMMLADADGTALVIHAKADD